MIVLVVISVFSVGYYTENRGMNLMDSFRMLANGGIGKIDGMKGVTGMVTGYGEGGMVMVTGGAVSDYSKEIEAAYKKNPIIKRRGFDGIIEAIIMIESSGGIYLTGDNKQSVGPMHVNIDTGKGYGYTEKELRENSFANIDAGAKKIAEIIEDDNFEGDVRQIIFGYNQGGVPSKSAVESGSGKRIYPNVDKVGADYLVYTRWNGVIAYNPDILPSGSDTEEYTNKVKLTNYQIGKGKEYFSSSSSSRTKKEEPETKTYTFRVEDQLGMVSNVEVEVTSSQSERDAKTILDNRMKELGIVNYEVTKVHEQKPEDESYVPPVDTEIYLVKKNGQITQVELPKDKETREKLIEKWKTDAPGQGIDLDPIDGAKKGELFTKKKDEKVETYSDPTLNAQTGKREVTLTMSDSTTLTLSQKGDDPNVFSGLLNGEQRTFAINPDTRRATFKVSSADGSGLSKEEVKSLTYTGKWDMNGRMILNQEKGDPIRVNLQEDGTFYVGGNQYYLSKDKNVKSAVLDSGATLTNEYVLLSIGKWVVDTIGLKWTPGLDESSLFYNKEEEKFYDEDNQPIELSADEQVIMRIEKELEGDSSLAIIYPYVHDGKIDKESSDYLLRKGEDYLLVSKESYDILSKDIKLKSISSISSRDGRTGTAKIKTDKGEIEVKEDFKNIHTIITYSEGDVTKIIQHNRLDGSITTTTMNKKEQTEEIETIHKDGSKETRITNDKTKTIRVEWVTKDKHKLSYSYKKDKSPKKAVFEMADGRKTIIKNNGGNNDITGAISDGSIGIEDLILAREIEEGTSLFGMGKEQTDSGWVFQKDNRRNTDGTKSKGILKIGDTTINLDENTAVRRTSTGGYVGYEPSPGGYRYYQGDGVKDKGNGVFFVNVVDDYFVIREFTSDHEEYGTEFRNGDYIFSGWQIYRNGELDSIITESIINGKLVYEAHKLGEFFDEDGEFRVPSGVISTATNELRAGFIKDKYTGYGRTSFSARLKGAYDAARGGRAWSTLLGLEDSGYRRTMDNFFANEFLGQVISGRWEDSICHWELPKDKEGLWHGRLQSGVVTVIVDLSGERSEVEDAEGKIQYLYKISYGINNPRFKEAEKNKKVRYNIELYRNGRKIMDVFKKDREIEEGAVVMGRPGMGEASVPVKYSSKMYDQVCIKFSDDLQLANGDYKDKFCRTITEPTGAPTAYSGEAAAAAGTEADDGSIYNEY